MAVCANCLRSGKIKKARHRHHLLSQTAIYRGLYPDLIDDPRNTEEWCDDCHLSKPLKKLTEIEFCRMLKIKPRSKSMANKIMQGKIEKFWDD